MKKTKEFKVTRGLVIKLIIILLATPLLIQMHCFPLYQLAKLLTPGSSGDWLQFWGSYFGFIPTGIVTYIVLDLQFARQAEVDKKNNKAYLNLQRQQFIFEKKYSKLEQQITIVNNMLKQFLTIKNTFENYEMTDKFARDVLEEFMKTVFSISENKMLFEAMSNSYSNESTGKDQTKIISLEQTIDELDAQRKILQHFVVNSDKKRDVKTPAPQPCDRNEVIRIVNQGVKKTEELLEKLNSILKDMNKQELEE